MVQVTQKKYFFSSITDWVRWNYGDGKVDYTEGVNAFTLPELEATTISTKIDGRTTTLITAIGNKELWKKCKVIIINDSDKLEGTLTVAWGVKYDDNKPRFICQRQTLSSKYPILMSNYYFGIDFGTRVPLMFSESNCPCFGKSFLRHDVNNIVLPNMDTKHSGIYNENAYRNNKGANMNGIQIDYHNTGDYSSEGINPYLMKIWNIDNNFDMYWYSIESIKWAIVNGLEKVKSTKTLTIGSTNLAKLTAEDIKIATDKGWTLA